MTVAAPGTAPSSTVRVLHLSDIHCGRPFVAEHMAAAERLAREQSWNAIVISGDFAQRARVHEFERAREILTRIRAIAPTLVVPGNHDTAWWHAPFGWGDAARLHERYRTYIDDNLEPTLHVPGVSMVGVNSAQGMLPATLTWYPRDWRVKGGVTDDQWQHARTRLEASPAHDLRILVVHHNVVRGRLSNRWGLKTPEHALDMIAAAGPHVVCTGHDHEERVEVVTRAHGRFIASTSNTLSDRMRGHRPSALNVIEADAERVTVTAWGYAKGAFVQGPMTVSMAR